MAQSPGQNAGSRPRVSARVGGLGGLGSHKEKEQAPPPPLLQGLCPSICLLCWKYSSPRFFFFFFFKLSATDLTSNVTSSGRTERSHRRARAGAATKLILPTLSHDQC